MTIRCLLGALVVFAAVFQPVAAADLIGFWDSPQKGANGFNVKPQNDSWFRALAGTGATWVRLTFSKWKGQKRDFLVGNADNYTGLVPEDLAILRKSLDSAHTAGLKVVIVPLSLPGARWTQHNDGRFDDQLWSKPVYAEQAVLFWKDLASDLKNHPAIAAYNLLNEPAPEKTVGLPENGRMKDLRAWQVSEAGTLRDLPTFYTRVIAAIRTVDPVTPIMVDGGYYANPRSLAAWLEKLSDNRVIYAFHMYEPYQATSAPNRKRKPPLRYPGVSTAYAGGQQIWNRSAVIAHVNHAFDWAKEQGLPPTRVVAGEFGCIRDWPDCATYLTDVMDAIEAHGGHWAFYTFRPDEWDAMDYELPASLKPGHYYWLTEQNKTDRLPRNGKLMGILKERIKN